MAIMTKKITDLDEIRRRVEERKNDEEKRSDRNDDGGGDSELPSSFIRACLRTNQHGDGELYKALHRGKFVYCKNMQCWLRWAGHHWEEDFMDDALASVENVADAYEKEAATIKKSLLQIEDKQIERGLNALIDSLEKRATQLRGDNRRQACLKFAHTSSDPLAISGHEIDGNPLLLGCRNGVIELTTGRFRPGRPDDWILKASPQDWVDINHPCPRWEQALSDIMAGDEHMVGFMHRLLGMSISGKVVEKIFPVLIGPGGDNGKTTLIEAISFALGPLGGPVSSDMLVAGYKPSSSGIDPSMMALKGLRFAYASETEDNAKVSAVRVKVMTGKDKLTARAPYDKRQTDFDPTHTLFLLSNFKLRADTEDNAFWNRTVYIPFSVRFVKDPKNPNERKADPYLDEALKAEASGILAWLVRGFLEWQKNGLGIPPKVLEESKRTRDDLDHFGNFIEECCFKKEGDEIGLGSSELYHFFDKWYRKNIGNFPPKIKKFGTYMKAHYESKKSSGVTRYYGLAIDYEVVRHYDPDASSTDYI